MKRTFLLFFLLLSQILFAQEDNYDKAVTLFNDGNRLQTMRNFEEAKSSFSQAADLFKSAGYIGNYIQCSVSEAIIYLKENNFAKASGILNTIQQEAIDNFGEQNQFLVLIYYLQGQLAVSSGRMDEAISYFEKTLEMNKLYPNPDPMFEANLKAAMGNVYLAFGDYDKAHDLYLQDLQIRLKIAGDRAPELPVAYNNLSITTRSMGKYRASLAYIEKGLAYAEERNELSGPTAALLYSGKGSILLELGQYHSALQYMQKALDIKKAVHGDRHKSIADEYNNLGLAYKSLREYSKAAINFRKAYQLQKQLLGSEHPDLAQTCNNLASVLYNDGKAESALKYYKEALNVTELAFGETHPNLGSFYHNMASVYKGIGDYDKTLEYYQKAEDIYAAQSAKQLRPLILIYINMGDTYRQIGEYKTALNYYQKALEINVNDFNPDEADLYSNPELKNYNDLNYLLYAVTGKAEAMTALYMQDSIYEYAKFSYETYLLSDSAINLRRINTDDEADKMWVGNQNRSIYESAVQAAVNLAYLQERDYLQYPYFEKAFYFSERNKAALLSEAVSASEARQFSGIPDSVIETELFLKRQISSIKKELLRTSDETERKRLQNNLFSFNREMEQWTAYAENNFPKYYEAQHQSASVKLKKLQSSLKPDQALISYFFSGNQLIIFTVLHDDMFISSQPAPHDMDAAVRNMREYLTSGLKSDFPKYLIVGYNLYDLLFPKKIPQSVSELIIIPDGILGVIPFEALLTEKYEEDVMEFSNYPFLIKDYQINYYYSATLFLKAQETKQSKDSISSWLGLAPVFADLTTANIRDFAADELPGTLEEINSIYEKIPVENNKQKITGSKLTKSQFVKLKLNEYDILHIATHGIVNTEHPELSGLLFYPEGTGEESILYSGEIYNLQLNSDLVVLSACETGLGKISKSEGIIGLTRSFLYAGAANILVSLWKVEDASTAQLMLSFYNQVLVGKSYSEALHLAKLEMIASKKTQAHPFFWSPFILIGH